MARLDALVGETRARLLLLLREASLSVPELAEALGISGNAVRTHIASAERDGLVQQAGIQRGSVGKPARIYELTPEAEELFPKAYALVLTELLRTLRQDDGDDVTRARLRTVGRRLGTRARKREAGPAARVAAAAAFLQSIGGTIGVSDEPDGWALRGTGCPLSAVVSEDPDVCVLTAALLSEATGLPVTESCQRSPRPRCAFSVLDTDRLRPDGQGTD